MHYMSMIDVDGAMSVVPPQTDLSEVLILLSDIANQLSSIKDLLYMFYQLYQIFLYIVVPCLIAVWLCYCCFRWFHNTFYDV